jgi:hypothetical protein
MENEACLRKVMRRKFDAIENWQLEELSTSRMMNTMRNTATGYSEKQRQYPEEKRENV